MLDRILNLVSKIIHEDEIIKPPLEVIAACMEIAARQMQWTHQVIGKSDKGHDLDVFKIGSGKHNILFYGFPDPGEAIGGNVILSMMKVFVSLHGEFEDLFKNCCWHFIPCANFDDQPYQGSTLVRVKRSPDKREFDWCVDDPRSDTKYFLAYVQKIQPKFTFAMHDEYHAWQRIPAYVGSTRKLSDRTFKLVNQVIKNYQIELSKDSLDPRLQPGFMIMDEQICEDFHNSTFKVLNQFGQVFTFELPYQIEYTQATLMRAQLAAGLCVIAHELD